MSMYRQIWLTIIVSTLLSLIGALLASTYSARTYLEQQLREKNIDNATSLALSLSQSKADSVQIGLVVAALFDSGHYESIRVDDPYGKTIVERHATSLTGAADMPAWFERNFRLQIDAGSAQISNGWQQTGTIHLMSQRRFAYQALWKSTLELTAILGIAGLLSAYLASVILRRLRAPLQAVIEQAKAITERRFSTIPEPAVPELKQLTAAMNFAVLRLKAMFDDETARLETLRRAANCDELTGLSNREHFLAQLSSVVDNEEQPPGQLMLIRIADLGDINRRLGRQTTDQVLQTIGSVIEQFAQQTNGIAARLNGADFGVLFAHTEPHQIAAQLLRNIIRQTATQLQIEPVAFIGFGTFVYGMESGAVLARVDAALAVAEASGVSAVREVDALHDDTAPNSAAHWTDLITSALSSGRVRLANFAVNDFSGNLLQRECPLRLQLGSDSSWQPAARFLAVAERLGLTAGLDLAALTQGLAQLSAEPKLPALAINLSAHSLGNAEFCSNVLALFDQHPLPARRLCVEFAEYSALAHFGAFQEFCRQLAGSGCRIGIEHFGRQFSQIGRLHELGLSYLKIDASFIRDIDSNRGNQLFLKGVTGIAHGIGLQVIAEGVLTAAEMLTLATLGFDAATGPAVAVLG